MASRPSGPTCRCWSAKLAALGVDVAMTTNGATLRGMAKHLRTAGLRRVNISLDSLDRAKFERMTRRDELANVLDGIEAAKEAGFDPVKINAVVERGVNDDEIVDLATFGRDRDVEVRFIEFMPLDAGAHWMNEQVVGQDEIVATIDAVYPLEQMPARGAAPADRWRYLDGRGTVGSHPDGHQAVLRRLRPGAAHRRRPVPHVPVRQRRVRPARCDARRGDRRRGGGPHRASGGHEMGRSSHRPGQLHPTGAHR